MPISLFADAKTLSKGEPAFTSKFGNSLETAKSYAEVWRIVKDTLKFSLGKRRESMMLFLDDLPLQLGAYHPIGTNNIVLNRALVEIVEAAISSRRVVNALVYNLLSHEYLHALGEYSEDEVRQPRQSQRRLRGLCLRVYLLKSLTPLNVSCG